MPKKVFEKIVEQTEAHLSLLKGLGINELSREKVEPVLSRKLSALRKLQYEEINDCRRCKLCKERKTIVFGEGDPNARVFFVGEGPGEKEDESGRPFVGAAGEVLTNIIEKGMKIPRSKVFIANVVKCRPPKNRDPEPDEIEACRNFLEKQVRIVKPKVIVALGRIAAQCLLKTSEPISQLRGMWMDFLGVPVMPTFHPSYLIHNPSGKREVWDDIKKVIRLLSEERA
jgi:DNA polymerase